MNPKFTCSNIFFMKKEKTLCIYPGLWLAKKNNWL